jgi:hypothetical protein
VCHRAACKCRHHNSLPRTVHSHYAGALCEKNCALVCLLQEEALTILVHVLQDETSRASAVTLSANVAATTVFLEQFTAAMGALREKSCVLAHLLKVLEIQLNPDCVNCIDPALQFGFAGWQRPNQKRKQMQSSQLNASFVNCIDPVLQFGFAGWQHPNQKLNQKKSSQWNPNCAD